MNTSTHPNSKTITIFRSGSYLSRAQKGPEVQEYLSMAKVSVGSYFEKDSQKVASGLTFAEEELLLPTLIDYTKDDRDFRKKVKEFYTEIDTRVPPNTGIPLEIGLEKNNANPVSKDNMPLNLMDFIRYKHAVNHPWMAENKEEADSNSNKQYYIFDKSKTAAVSKVKNDERDAALGIYLQVKENLEKVDMMLTLLLEDPRKYPLPGDRVDKLHEFANKQPDKVIGIYKDENFETRYTIQTLVNTKIIQQLGLRYVGSDGKIIGNSLDETIFWFKDDMNSDQVALYKATMQEKLLQPIVHEKRRTEKLKV